jgi:DNA polymerase elongation subunit (family B)
LNGWLLDLYPDPQDGLTLWLLEDTPQGKARRLQQSFPVTFYAAGPPKRLRALWKHLRARRPGLELERCQRRELFHPEPLVTLAIRAPNPIQQPRLFAQLVASFPDLDYYDADLPLALRHAARYGTFPQARLHLEVDAGGRVQALETLDSPWELDPEQPPLRVMTIEPDKDPHHAPPTLLTIRCERRRYRLPLHPARPLLVNLRALLERHDPDLLLTAWGDTWLLPHLLELSEKLRLPLPLNRDPRCAPRRKAARSYFAYGQVIHRGQQVQLYGRLHIDIHNAMMFHDYGLEGAFESARLTAQPLQDAARLSPGSGISAMQIITALRWGVLVPWRKAQPETNRGALDLIHADQGGLVYQPLTGLHAHVAEIDFISMYPSIMAHFNVSPETICAPPAAPSRIHPAPLLSRGIHTPAETASPQSPPPAYTVQPLSPPSAEAASPQPPPPAYTVQPLSPPSAEAAWSQSPPPAYTVQPPSPPSAETASPQSPLPAYTAQPPLPQRVPELDLWIDQEQPGLVPETLRPLLNKRIQLKARLGDMPAWHPKRKRYKARTAAQKWLLVTCFGYLGYKNARFGRIEAHQAVTAYSRECLLRAKEAAEDCGGEVLHMYVDGLWVQLPGVTEKAGLQALLVEVSRRTGLPVSLEGIYRWVAFLPSRVDPRRPVANRYFGVFQDGEIKVRGIEARRQDTPPFIARTQMEVLEILAGAPGAEELPGELPQALALLRRQLRQLRLGRAPLEELLVTQKLSRELGEYRVPSPVARAAAQLEAAGKPTRPGQYIRFLYTRGKPGVHAWDRPTPPDPAALDTARYTELLLRAASTVLGPLGADEATLRDWLLSRAAYGAPPGEIPPAKLPLLDLAAPNQCQLFPSPLGEKARMRGENNRPRP